jgi:hypothetical protein
MDYPSVLSTHNLRENEDRQQLSMMETYTSRLPFLFLNSLSCVRPKPGLGTDFHAKRQQKLWSHVRKCFSRVESDRFKYMECYHNDTPVRVLDRLRLLESFKQCGH